MLISLAFHLYTPFFDYFIVACVDYFWWSYRWWSSNSYILCFKITCRKLLWFLQVYFLVVWSLNYIPFCSPFTISSSFVLNPQPLIKSSFNSKKKVNKKNFIIQPYFFHYWLDQSQSTLSAFVKEDGGNKRTLWYISWLSWDWFEKSVRLPAHCISALIRTLRDKQNGWRGCRLSYLAISWLVLWMMFYLLSVNSTRHQTSQLTDKK